MGGTVLRGLGVIARPLADDEATQLRVTSGVVVLDVLNPSRAEEAGLQRYDVILAIGEQRVESAEDLEARVNTAAGRREQTLLLYRGGMRGTLTLPAAQ